ncbi:MAG TPA: catalase-related domain-containing protein [Stellaceae bacterium]|nr:catalase-related domain-containing protein [Stellaceae bacterium]
MAPARRFPAGAVSRAGAPIGASPRTGNRWPLSRRPSATPIYREPPLPIAGDADRDDHRAGNDDYTQAGNLFRLMTPEQQRRLIAAIVGAMQSVPRAIQRRQVRHFAKCDPAYGAGVAAGLGLAPSEIAAE